MPSTIQLLTFAPTNDGRLVVHAWGTPSQPRPESPRLFINQPPPDDAGVQDMMRLVRETKPGVVTLLDTEDPTERSNIEVTLHAHGYTGLAWVDAGENMRQLTTDLPTPMRGAVEEHQKAMHRMEQVSARLAVTMRPRALGPSVAQPGLTACPTCHNRFSMIRTMDERQPLPGDQLACGGQFMGNDCAEIFILDGDARIVRPRVAPLASSPVGILVDTEGT
jgi:hypothetical protein